ncbi:LysR family transcriptional regulator [Pararhizobium sp. YC-54]|uniref:LysR family transcriptional regulator n=1 Tax=Pararhizobium sp. YC-54 TaxID=2986920 RepID=UPI0021F74E24|nr:LysR family transcriptional regulator [Pararhizobium sp. YC-54]MCW0000105.1 LysR family transcriptional regulator [Pararhizobium sp. YC-54]
MGGQIYEQSTRDCGLAAGQAKEISLQIDWRTLKFFDAIRRYGSIREAARRLFIDSSALNRQLLSLEKEVGMPLFERLPRGLKLTAAGEIFARHVVTVLQDEERLASELDELKGDYRGEIRLMSVEGLSAGLVAPVIKEMILLYPNVKMVVKNGSSSQNAKAVADGDADLALSFSSEHTGDLRRCHLGRFGLGVILRPDHPLACRGQVSFAECAAYPLIFSSPELTISHEMAPVIAKHKGPLKVLLETASVDLAKSIAALGLGIAFQTRLGLESEIQEGRLAFVPLKTSPRAFSELSIYVRSGRSLLPALDAFAGLLIDELGRREAEEAQKEIKVL